MDAMQIPYTDDIFKMGYTPVSLGLDRDGAFTDFGAFKDRHDAVVKWIRTNRTSKYMLSRSKVWFENPKDALMFKLIWG